MNYKQLSTILFIFVWVFAANETISAQNQASPRRKTTAAAPAIGKQAIVQKISPELQRRVETFNLVWQTVKSNYFDQTFSGLDWNKIRDEFEPRVMQTKTDKELHDLLGEMISRLNRSHFAIIPPDVYQAIERAKKEAKAREKQQNSDEENASAMDADADEDDEETEADENFQIKFGIGIEMRLINDKFVITRVEKNSTAEVSGVKTGFEIDKINDVSLNSLLAKLDAYGAKARTVKRYLPVQITQYMLNGEKDTFVKLTCLDATEKPLDFRVQREALKGSTISIGENYPEQFLRFETDSISEDVGYIKFNLFALPVVEKFCAALTELKNKKAIIVDLRGNHGGILGTLIGLGGMLTDKSINIGTSIYKVGSENMIANSKAKNYQGKIVVLVDNQTVSAAEIFAAALQENNRAIVIGDKTAGEALPSVSAALPTGAVLLYPIANFKTRDGNFLEGKGVEPNFTVSLDRKSLLEGKDIQLETALRFIKEDKTVPKKIEETNSAPVIRAIVPPPPPPPAPAPRGKVLGEVNISGGLTTRVETETNKIDPKAEQIITDFTNKIGGAENLKKINSYTVEGSSDISLRGTKSNLDISILRLGTDKYAEIMKSNALGEIRQIYTDKKTFLQADYGLEQEFPFAVNPANVEILAPIFNLANKENFKTLKYEGIFDKQGRKVHVINAKTADNLDIAFAFDVETKLLIGFEGALGAATYGDYRQVETLQLPFYIERSNIMMIEIDEIKLNPAISEKDFARKENCYDKAN